MLEEIRQDDYKNEKIFKERTKNWHGKHIMRREFKKGEIVMLFNSRLKLFPKKLRSRLFGPFKVLQVFLYGVVKVWSESLGAFKVNENA